VLLLIAQALANAKKHHGHSGEREVDADNKSPCLWCGQKIPVVRPSAPKNVNFGDVRKHEALHQKGELLRDEFVCPHRGCEVSFGTDVDEAWKHAWEAHGIPRDDKRCLFENCPQGMDPRGKQDHRFKKPCDYKRHESKHTGIFPFNCSCGKGFKDAHGLKTHQAKCLPPKVASSAN